MNGNEKVFVSLYIPSQLLFYFYKRRGNKSFWIIFPAYPWEKSLAGGVKAMPLRTPTR
jgi:hypothetical protein